LGNVTTNVKVDNNSTGGQHLPATSLGPFGEIYIAWVDCADTDVPTSTCNVNPLIYFARSIDGGMTFDPKVAITDGTGYANGPKIATDEDGNIYVVWHDDRAGSNFDVYLAKSTNGGVSFSSSIMVNEVISGTYYQYEPDLAVDRGGNIYVSWNRYYYDGNLGQWDYDIYMARSTDGGASFGTNVKVNDGSGWQYKSSIAVGQSRNVYMAWTDTRNGGVADIYFAKSTDGGTTFSQNTQVNRYSNDSQSYPEVALDGDENIYVVWNDGRRYSQGSWDVYMACSKDHGKSFIKEVRINDADISTTNNPYPYPVITASAHGQVAISWDDNRAGDWDVYLTYSGNGGANFKPSWRVNDVTTGSQSVPDIIMGLNGFVYCTWRDTRSGGFDTYFALDLGKSAVGLLRPYGKEIIPSGSTYTVQWTALLQVVTFNLSYSLDNGMKWIPIADKISGVTLDWVVPTPKGNKTSCLIKVIGYDVSGKKVGEDKSHVPFAIEVVKLTAPDLLTNPLVSGDPYSIQWITNDTIRSVEGVNLFYTLNGGGVWKSVLPSPVGNPGTYSWKVPVVTKEKTRCKVKVVLKDVNGITVGSDISDAYFTISP
jgi:hypothetical protein